MPSRLRRSSSEQRVAWLVLSAVTAFVFWELHLMFLFRDTTPAFVDLGDHLTGPSHLRETLLPQGRITGWSHSWFTGFPSFTFYFPVPPLIAVLFDLVLPYNAAFKLTASIGPFTLAPVAYAFGRLNDRSRVTSALYAVAMVPVLLQPLLWRLGGSIAAAAIGEYSYGIAFSCSLLALGFAAAGLRTGRYRALTAVVLAVGLMSHVIPAITTFIGLAVLTAMRPGWAKVRWTATVVGAALALSAVWLLPLLFRLPFTSGPSAEKTASLWAWMWPGELAPIAILAGAGLTLATLANFAGAMSERLDLDVFMTVMAVASAMVMVVFPSMPVEDTRFLPMWFMWLCLLAAQALARLAEVFDRQRARARRGQALRWPNLARLAMPGLALITFLSLWDSRLVDGLLMRSKTKGNALGYAELNMRGYEHSPFAVEFDDFISMIRRVARERGCGRAELEWVSEDRGGPRMAVTDLVPHWTDGCITATTGIVYQSSAMTPYLLETSERLSHDPSVMDGERHDFDLARGMQDLRMLGVRYLVTYDPRTARAAEKSPALAFVAQTKAHDGRRWQVYELSDVRLVEPLRYVPIVVRGIDRSRQSWEDAAHRWYDKGDRDVLLLSDGPPQWPRRERAPEAPPRTSVPSTTVRRVRINDETVTFDVSKTGVPVLVKVSWFPNWRVEGGDGPWRATPNQMVVVPHSSTVTLRYERSVPELIGLVGTIGGAVATTVLARRPPLTMPVIVEPPSDPTPRRPRRPSKSRRKKSRR